MAFFDWDRNGKMDLVDDIIEYNIYQEVMGEADKSEEETYDSFNCDEYDDFDDDYSYGGSYDYSADSNSDAYSGNYNATKSARDTDSILDSGEGVVLCAIIALVINISIFKDAAICEASLTFMLVIWLIISFIVAAIIDMIK